MLLTRTPSRITTITATLAAALAATLTLGTPAHAAGDGTGVIRGTVLETGHVIAPGMDVSLYRTSGEFVDATVANSQAGAYEFAGLEAGSYTLWFENQNEAVSEWYDNQPDKPQATPIVLADGATYVADAYLTQVSENLVRPTVSGTAAVGSVLTASRGTWYPTASVEFRYQWLRGGSPIDGATLSTYTLRAADGGSRISVEVVAVHQGATESAVSGQTATVTGGTPPTPTVSNTAVPSITGSTTAGSVLTAAPGGWSPADATVSLQWLRGATVVGTGATYTSTTADVGTTLRVRATATKSGWTSATADSAAFGPVVAATVPDPPDDVTPPAVTAPVNTALPTVAGTSRVGSTLTASTGTWSGEPTGYSYQWTRNGAPIAGATSSKLLLGPADAGRTIGVVVTATNTGGTTTASSATTPAAKASSKVAATVTSPKKGRLTVKVAVASAGGRSGKVAIVVRVRGKAVTKTYVLSRGAKKVTLSRLRSGRATVTVRYAGDTSTAAAQVVKKATVR
jgi:hypothetical protein